MASTSLTGDAACLVVSLHQLGLEWGDKKSICNKFPQSSSITCLTWPSAQPNSVVFGLQDGKVKIGRLRTNKPATLYNSNSYVVSCASDPEGNAIVSGHVDGSIYRFFFEDGARGPSHSKFTHHPCVPYGLAWGHSVVAAGNDCKVVFYDNDGALQRTFDYLGGGRVKEFTCATFNPSGESCVLGNFNKFFVYNFNSRTEDWEEVATKDVESLYTVTALAWKPDGSRLAMGSLCGVVDLYDACIRRTRYRGKFEFTYVSLSQVIVKRLSSGTRIVLKSHFGCEIQKINIFQDRYLVAHTPETLLMGDLESCKLSEVPWTSSGTEKFFFDNPSVCMVFSAGQLALVEYGRNETLGACRTEHMNPHLISVRINERPPARSDDDLDMYAAGGAGAGAGEGADDNKKIAYLLDVLTIAVLDLVTGITVATINHDAKIDWLELNGRANLVLFRDKRRRLHLFDIQKQSRTTLLSYCNYVQWVPGSDVVVAQNRNNLCVWYNIAAPDKVTIYQIKGDVDEIERAHGKTEVVVDEGVNTASYILDEGLIGFGTAIEDRNLDGAMAILEELDLTSETEAMWQQLSDLALRMNNLHVAQRCAAALGDVSRARFLMKTTKIAMKAEEQMGGDGRQWYLVRARMAQLRQDFTQAEHILVDQGKVDECIEMYQTMHKWDEALRVADMRNHPQRDEMRNQYFQYLLESGQEERAAQLKEREGDFQTAINLYLKGGLPAKAVAVIHNRPSNYDTATQEKVAAALVNAGMHDKAGALLERMREPQRALEAYVNGNAFRPAVELARRSFPGQVVKLEQAWGDYLVSQKQVDAAINHYIEAGQHVSAINAALNAKQFGKAVQMVEDTLGDPEVAKPFYRRIARHYQEAGQLPEAERFYVKAGTPQDAVEMYTRANKLDAAHALAVSCMSEADVGALYIDQAHRAAAAGKYKEAEKLFLTVNEEDRAINMYRKAGKFEQMLRLVKKHRPDVLPETHLHLAQDMEMQGNLKGAEKHYAEAGEWESAVNMYRSNDMWDEAFHVAKFRGGQTAANRVAYAWALSLGGEAGAKLLSKLGLTEQAIDYAIDSGAFDHAFQLARASLRRKLPDVHLKHALYLEDEGRFREAETEFIKAEKPKEPIEMYIHQQDWKAAMRVAESFHPASIPDVLVAQARVAVEAKDFDRAERLFVDAHKPDLALRAYIEAHNFPDALRVAKKHLPHKVREVNAEIQRIIQAEGGRGGTQDHVKTARMWEDNRDYALAIQAYLNVTKEHIPDADALRDVWMKAVALARQHEKRQYPRVCEDVARRLMGVGKFQEAASMFRDVESYKEAIDCYIRAGEWNEARSLARLPAAKQYSQYVEKRYKAHLADEGDADNLAAAGATDAALDLYVKKGQWEQVFEVAAKQGGAVYKRYAVMYTEQQLKAGEPASVVKAFARFGPPRDVPVATYKQLVEAVFAAPGTTPDTLNKTRDVIYKVVADLRRGAAAANSPSLQEAQRLLLVLHYVTLRETCQAHGLGDLDARLAVSLLRFGGVIPADRVFYEAGMACRSQNWTSMAFVLCNRYLVRGGGGGSGGFL